MQAVTSKTDIFEDICNDLHNYKPGERFLSVRKLMQKYSVSQRVVESVLEKLVARNMISVISGEGMFVNDLSAKKVRQIMYLCPDWPSVAFSEFEHILQAEAAIKGDFVIGRKNFPYKESFFRNIDHSGYDAIIINPASSEQELPHQIDLASLPIPVVVLGKELNDVTISSSVGRDDISGLLAASYFIQNGHEKLAVLVSEPHCHGVCIRYTNFCKFAELSGKSAKIIDCHTISGEKADDKAYEILRAYLEQNGLDFTALFVVSDMSALGAMKAILERGYNIPDDVSIIGHDGLNQGKFFHPALTSIKIDNATRARKVLNGLRELFKNNGKGYFHIDIEPELLIRDSVKNLNI